MPALEFLNTSFNNFRNRLKKYKVNVIMVMLMRIKNKLKKRRKTNGLKKNSISWKNTASTGD